MKRLHNRRKVGWSCLIERTVAASYLHSPELLFRFEWWTNLNTSSTSWLRRIAFCMLQGQNWFFILLFACQFMSQRQLDSYTIQNEYILMIGMNAIVGVNSRHSYHRQQRHFNVNNTFRFGCVCVCVCVEKCFIWPTQNPIFSYVNGFPYSARYYIDDRHWFQNIRTK